MKVKTAGEAQPAADASAPVEAAPATERPAGSRKAARKSRGARGKQQQQQMIEAAVAKAEAERQPLRQEAERLSDAGNLEAAVGLLAGGAEALRDPVLHLSAAEARQKLAKKRGKQEAIAEWEASVRHCDSAAALLTAEVAPEATRVDPEEVGFMRTWESELRGNASAALPELRKATNPVRRNAKGELISGSILLAGGVAGLGVMSGGLWLNGAANRELAKVEGLMNVDTGPLDAQKQRADTMIAAGAVAGALGVALGVTLVALGARDLKAARAERLARVRVAPTLGGIVLSGRF